MRLRLVAVFLALAITLPLLISISVLHSQSSPASLLQNGGFESGVSGWEGLSAAQLTSDQVHGGTSSVRIAADQMASQGWIDVTPGQTYVATIWFKWVTFNGSQWGEDVFQVQDDTFTTLASLSSLHNLYTANTWHKLALTVVPTRAQLRVSFGVFGPQDQVEIYVDDASLFTRDSNQAPSSNPTASLSAGAAPLNVSFQANADDADGAVQAYQWLFGDGSEERVANPSHRYIARGSYSVELRVWDNDGALTTASLPITVSDTQQPNVTITGPSEQASYVTSTVTLSLTGQASTPSDSVEAISWDNLRTGAAGALNLTPGASLSWATPAIDLAPGANEILISVIDSRGMASSDRLVVTRQVSGPQITAIQAAASQVRQYQKYEVSFQVATVSAYPLFRYDESPPSGVVPGIGVTVEGVITTPSGRTLRQPAFYSSDVIVSGSGDNAIYEPTNQSGWKLRFAPTELGVYQVALSVQDASGAATATVGSFTAIEPTRQGFVQVSAADTRYFSYSNGDLFWPIGPAWAVDYAGGKGFNFVRPWMAGLGIYSTNFARWKSSAQQSGNEGFSSQLSYNEHYPGHELAQELSYPEGYRMWVSGYLDDQFSHRFKPNTSYQVRLRLKVVNLAGPRDPAYPYGLVVKLHSWPNEATFEADNRASASLIPQISVERDWHTLVATYTTAADEGVGGKNHLSIYLENVTSGQAYIDGFSIREVLPTGLGPELVRHPDADLHTFIEQRPAAAIDEQLSQGEANGIFFKYVVHDKNDWIQNHLSPTGVFVNRGAGYYQPAGTRARWLLEQWWRYIAARWGYSTAVHSWELNNEGPPEPNGGVHMQMAQDFAHFMQRNDVHPHLATTSFWCCWTPNVWDDTQRYPNLGYADIHEYIQASETFADGSPRMYDEARFQAETSLGYAASQVGKPIIRGETGIVGEPAYTDLQQPNSGVWFHNLLWAQLNPGAVFDPGYWFSEHFSQIDPAPIAQAFARFVSSLDVQLGGYRDVAAQVNNPMLRVYGQRNLASGKAFFWVQNRLHTWRNVMGVENPIPITAQSGTVTLTLQPNARYRVAWWDTTSGTVSSYETLPSDASGQISLTIDALMDDLAVQIAPAAVYLPFVRR